MSLKFGTSGIRALSTDLTDRNVYLAVTAFLQYEASKSKSNAVYVAGDLRESSPKILGAVYSAVADNNREICFCGNVPTPCLANYSLLQNAPAIMVTGSHIPADRNGLKFYLNCGETLKEDDAKILEVYNQLLRVNYKDELFSSKGDFATRKPVVIKNIQANCIGAFESRYMQYFGGQALKGLRIVFYEHSSVARDFFPFILEKLGATVLRKGRSDRFVAVDTEAVDSLEQFAEWVKESKADALISADGDADRPLVIDNLGALVPGDTLGMLTCRYLTIEAVALPISCNSSINNLPGLQKISFTKIGSPFVIDELDKLALNFNKVAGFEANGGFILKTSLPGLAKLSTRDSLLPIVCALTQIKNGMTLNKLANEVNLRFTASVLIRDCQPEMSQKLLKHVLNEPESAFKTVYLNKPSDLTINTLDGVRLASPEGVVHFRPSGNAAEFRCYTEACTSELAQNVAKRAQEFIKNFIQRNS